MLYPDLDPVPPSFQRSPDPGIAFQPNTMTSSAQVRRRAAHACQRCHVKKVGVNEEMVDSESPFLRSIRSNVTYNRAV